MLYHQFVRTEIDQNMLVERVHKLCIFIIYSHLLATPKTIASTDAQKLSQKVDLFENLTTVFSFLNVS